MSHSEKKKDQMRRLNAEKREQRRMFAFKLLGGCCVRCGATEGLEFDHIDSTTKTDTIAGLWTAREATFLAELRKCQILCKECHQTKTLTETYGERRHGTMRMYKGGGCHCSQCRSANAAKTRKRRRKPGCAHLGL